ADQSENVTQSRATLCNISLPGVSENFSGPVDATTCNGRCCTRKISGPGESENVTQAIQATQATQRNAASAVAGTGANRSQEEGEPPGPEAPLDAYLWGLSERWPDPDVPDWQDMFELVRRLKAHHELGRLTPLGALKKCEAVMRRWLAGERADPWEE